MKTAKEMFEALGFNQYTINQTNLIIGWQKSPKKDTSTHEFKNIQFYTDKTWGIFSGYITEALVFNRPTVEEHLAISQQMKELGWIE